MVNELIKKRRCIESFCTVLKMTTIHQKIMQTLLDIIRFVRVMPWITTEHIHELESRDTAKKPNIEGDGYAPDGTFIYDTWICPNCNEHYEIDYDDYDFCPICGQRIDRSELE